MLQKTQVSIRQLAPFGMTAEKRNHTRIELPFQVEIQHASLGNVKTIATNISAGGMFVELDNPTTTIGSFVNVTVLSLPLIESPPTPSIKMIVRLCSSSGLGLEFSSNTSRHLWETVDRARNTLIVGEDYFQVFQNAVIVNANKQVLLVQQAGKWLLPGGYLKVSEDWQSALKNALEHSLGLKQLTHVELMGIDSYPDITAKEAAIFTVFHQFSSPENELILPSGGQYKKAKWFGHEREINELTFSHPLLRSFALKALASIENQTQGPLLD